ncbi:MAG: hypothetical protein EA366_06120 [Spirulina sp. DLM2.Bin59]|nr:MAG: hypothetical protein EA366_06120 [Spirulina sp. DLM2.Bin59]
MPQPQDRQASILAGLIGAMVYGLLNVCLLLLWGKLPLPPLPGHDLTGLTLAIALGTGFLFGVAYRYTVRGDRNPHLWQGVVWAFSGVRTGALWQAHPHWGWLELATLGLESVICFGGAAVVLILRRDGWAMAAPLPSLNAGVEEGENLIKNGIPGAGSQDRFNQLKEG